MYCYSIFFSYSKLEGFFLCVCMSIMYYYLYILREIHQKLYLIRSRCYNCSLFDLPFVVLTPGPSYGWGVSTAQQDDFSDVFLYSFVFSRVFVYLWFFIPLGNFFHLYEYVTITGEGLRIQAQAWHSWPLSSESSLACHT